MIKGIRFVLAKSKERKLIRDSGIIERDFFLASFPKSGNTWIRYILARAMYPEHLIDQSNILEYFPSVYRSSPDAIRKLNPPRFIKTHGTFFDLYPKTIYVIRDYRNVVLSAWHHAKNKANYSGWIDQFVEEKKMNAFGPWHWHVSEALNYHEANRGKMLVLQYESMLKDPEASIHEIINFTGIKPIISIKEIAGLTQFKTLQEMEKRGGQNPEQLFFREGSNAGWQQTADWVLEDKLLDKPSHEVMRRCGYIE